MLRVRIYHEFTAPSDASDLIDIALSSINAASEFVVPRSIPIIRPIFLSTSLFYSH